MSAMEHLHNTLANSLRSEGGHLSPSVRASVARLPIQAAFSFQSPIKLTTARKPRLIKRIQPRSPGAALSRPRNSFLRDTAASKSRRSEVATTVKKLKDKKYAPTEQAPSPSKKLVVVAEYDMNGRRVIKGDMLKQRDSSPRRRRGHSSSRHRSSSRHSHSRERSSRDRDRESRAPRTRHRHRSSDSRRSVGSRRSVASSVTSSDHASPSPPRRRGGRSTSARRQRSSSNSSRSQRHRSAAHGSQPKPSPSASSSRARAANPPPPPPASTKRSPHHGNYRSSPRTPSHSKTSPRAAKGASAQQQPRSSPAAASRVTASSRSSPHKPATVTTLQPQQDDSPPSHRSRFEEGDTFEAASYPTASTSQPKPSPAANAAAAAVAASDWSHRSSMRAVARVDAVAAPGSGTLQLRQALDEVDRKCATSTSFSPEVNDELNRLRMLWRRKVREDMSVSEELGILTRRMAEADDVLDMVNQTREQELLINANLAKLLLRSPSTNFDSHGAEYLNATLSANSGDRPAPSVAHAALQSKFDDVEALLMQDIAVDLSTLNTPARQAIAQN